MNMKNKLAEQQLKKLSSNFRLTPATLAHRLNPRWVASPHLMYMSLEIAKAIHQGDGRIIISVPPRHGKSELITKYTSIWALEHFPEKNVILTTYGAELSTDFGREVRDIIQDKQDLLSFKIKKDAGKAANWKTEQGGGMAAVGLGGAITGRGADVLLIDDFIKEIKEALSPTYREYMWNWFVTVALTRLEPKATCIIIATRWHDDDLIGRILKHNPGGRWRYIKFPAFAEEDDLLGRPIGAPLFPERYDTDALQERKDTLGSFFFNALFQQNPVSDSGKLTNPDWLEIIDIMPNMANLPVIRIWDLAATENAGDYTAGALCTYDRSTNIFYVLNVIRRQLSSQQVETLVRQTAIADGLDTKIHIEQEPGASGKALVTHFKNTVLPEFTVETALPSDGKLIRAQPFLAAAEAGKVKILKGDWNIPFLAEFEDFPTGAHDDQIDAVAEGYTKLSGKKFKAATWGRGILPAIRDLALKPRTKSCGIVIGRRRRR